MCNAACIAFAARTLDVHDRDILEVGAYSIGMGGSVRQTLAAQGPRTYVGLDIMPGPGVDVVGSVYDLLALFGTEAFDVVVATEILEHLRDWRPAVIQMKACLRPGGQLLVTTRSWGFPFHRGPWDWWRYEPDDMAAIFRDFELIALEQDGLSPGVFALARKPLAHTPIDLSSVSLRSIHTGRRQRAAHTTDLVRSVVAHPVHAAKYLAPPSVKRAVRRASPD